MENGLDDSEKPNVWRPMHAYVLAVVCLLIGLLVGYLLRGSAAPPRPIATAAPESPHAAPAQSGGMGQGQIPTQGQMPTLDQMKQMADTEAAPLLEKLKRDPKNFSLLVALGDLYRSTHQFKEAGSYFDQALQVDPKNVPVRTAMATCLYYTGDVDGALAQLEKALTYDPKHAGALMNLGLIKWKGKNDVPGAVAAWEKLLKLNPDFAQKDAVQRMINEAEQSKKTQGWSTQTSSK